VAVTDLNADTAQEVAAELTWPTTSPREERK
jgi:hypothetical protein